MWPLLFPVKSEGLVERQTLEHCLQPESSAVVVQLMPSQLPLPSVESFVPVVRSVTAGSWVTAGFGVFSVTVR